MVTDPISDFLVKLSNASVARKQTVSVPHSKFIEAVADILAKEGYLSSVEKKGKKKARRQVEVTLVYESGIPKINGVRRISKPSRRIYQKSSKITPVRNGFGRMIISTPQGLLTDVEARKAHIGGELLFKIW